jgi:lipoprotein-releasing system ATP-binding protein
VTNILICENLKKAYNQETSPLEVLKGVNLTIATGKRIAIVGRSGEGKSTLLNILGVLDLPTSGKLSIAGIEVNSLNDNQRADLRNQFLGFVYQFHHLLPEFNALENVAMPALIAHKPINELKEYASYLLEIVGLKDRILHKPSQLSGGERQRVAIARSLVNKPQLVLLDEPTGNLDFDNALKVQELMLKLSQTLKTSFLIVTHDLSLAQKMDKTYTLKDGQLV